MGTGCSARRLKLQAHQPAAWRHFAGLDQRRQPFSFVGVVRVHRIQHLERFHNPAAGRAKLAALGIESIGDIAAKDRAWLVQHFGAHYGSWLHEASHGADERPVVTHSEPVSMSRETTFDRDLHARRDKAELGAIFTRLAEQVAADLQRKGYVGKTIGIKLRYDDFKGVTRDLTLEDRKSVV